MNHEGDYYDVIPAREEHIPFFGPIEQACAKIFPVEAVPRELLLDITPPERLLEAIRDSRAWAVVRGDSPPVGFSYIRYVEAMPLLAEVDVHPEHGRQGLGRRLVSQTLEYAADKRLPALYLTTFSDIPWNAPFYRSMGFLELGEDDIPAPLAAILRDEWEVGFRGRIAMARFF